MQEEHRKYHEVANIFPLMQGEELEALKADIAENGLLEPIWLHPDGSIIDGRNRYRACLESGVEPRFETWNGNGSLVAFTVSMNLFRRHLDAGQIACIGVDVKDRLSKEIAEELSEKGRAAIEKRWYGPEENWLSEKEDESDEIGLSKNGQTYRDAFGETAQLMGVSRGYIGKAYQLRNEAVDLFEAVRGGDMKMPAAMRELNHRNKKESPPLPTGGKYRIIYADPPWKYSNSGAIESKSGGEIFTRVEQHYPSMFLEEICEMGAGVKGMSEDDAVLFLWATSPMLRDAFDVIDAWGFKYKTSFVWNKVRHTYGHYNSVRHEFLLVATRGSCTPDRKELFNSVITIERSSKNSQKPEDVRRMIDEMYTYGNRIELFAREQVEGWERWGNE